MKFTILHDAQSRPPRGGPVTVSVTKEPRKDYQHPCACSEVYVVAAESLDLMVERGLILAEHRDRRVAVCSCLGTPAAGTLALRRPLVILDLEGTSIDVTESRIVEFACTVLNPDGTRRRFCQRFNPGVPIPPSATEVHGIPDADVANCPPFSDFAAKIQKGLEGKDIGGYNLRQYDLPVMENEYARAGLKFTLNGSAIVDVFGLYQKLDPRDLTAAVRKYCGRDHAGAHGAQADCDAAADVLCGQIAMHSELNGMSVEDLARFSVRGDHEPVDIAGKIGRNADGKLVYLFGKHRGQTVESEPGFAAWVLSKDFAESTKEVLRAELERLGL